MSLAGWSAPQAILKWINHSSIVETKGSQGSATFHPCHPSTIHLSTGVLTQCQALCWAPGNRIKKTDLISNSRELTPCQVRWMELK